MERRGVGARGRAGDDGDEPRRQRPDPSPLDIAARMLQRGPLSEAALHGKLTAKGYRPDTATATVARCRDLGWVHDDGFAHDRARTLRRRGAGGLKIAADLQSRAIPDALIDRAVTASLDGESEQTWARRTLAASGAASDPARAWRLLAGRGFPEEVIADIVDLGE